MFSSRTVLSRSSFCFARRKSSSVLVTKKTMMAEVMTSSGSIVRARLRLVLIIRIRLPRMISVARVPRRSVTRMTLWTPAGEADEQVARPEPIQVA